MGPSTVRRSWPDAQFCDAFQLRSSGITTSIAGRLASGQVSDDDLGRVQRRRELPTRVIQRAQLAIQNQFLSRALERRGEVKAPLAMRLLQRFPVLRRIPARLVGVGIRPEHVRVPGANSTLQRAAR